MSDYDDTDKGVLWKPRTDQNDAKVQNLKEK